MGEVTVADVNGLLGSAKDNTALRDELKSKGLEAYLVDNGSGKSVVAHIEGKKWFMDASGTPDCAVPLSGEEKNGYHICFRDGTYILYKYHDDDLALMRKQFEERNQSTYERFVVGPTPVGDEILRFKNEEA